MMILIYLLILSITNVFGMFNVLQEYRLPGIGKPSDFILILLNLFVIFNVLTKKTAFNNVEKKFVKIVLLILAYVFFLIFYSSVITGRESFNYALRVGGIYLYYSAFFFPIFLLNKEKHFYQFINFLRIGGLVTGGIAIISNIVGYSVANSVITTGDYGSFVRVYLSGFFNYFVIIFWTVQYITKKRSKIKIHYIEMIISLLGIILFLGRTRMIVLILMLVLVLYILANTKKSRKMILTYFAIIIFGLVLTSALTGFKIDEIIQRFQEGYVNTEQGSGTFNFRLYAIGIGYEIFAKMPFFGTGFIHSNSNFYSQLITNSGIATTNNTDFGLASILFTTGIIGFGLITYFVISFLINIKKQINLFKKTNSLNIKFIYSLTIFIIVLFVFFVQQLSGNVFGSRNVAFYMLSMGFAVKIFSKENFIKSGTKNEN